MKKQILSYLKNHPWQHYISCHDCIPSTNDLAKALAKDGAPEGTVVVAAEQTAGRGRLGRTFHAPAGLGLYFSVILRPQCPPEELLHLTCAAGVAACNAIQNCTGHRPRIKWTNDLVFGTKKLGGILTELSVSSKTGLVEWAVIGIGINCRHQITDFPPQLQDMATSLVLSTGQDVAPAQLAANLIVDIYWMRNRLLTEKPLLMDSYRKDCMTVGQQIVLVRGENKQYGTALDVDENGGLVVRFDDNTVQTVQSGEVSVRGLYGYA